MTAIRQTAISASSFELEHKPPVKLELALDSISILKRYRKLSVTDLGSASKFRGWLESSASEGERWLRSAVQDGDLYAMEKLGERLVTGDGLTKSVEEGLTWLKKSAELGNTFAMEKLANYVLDEYEATYPSSEGERWLRNAAEQGNRAATVNLATRLITGNGLESDPEEGERLLRQAAEEGSQIAMVKLGVYQLCGWGLNQNREEGLRALQHAGAASADALLVLGVHLYQQSLSTTTKTARGLAREAGILFKEAWTKGNSIAAVNLAYLLRRGEIPHASCPSLDELLLVGLKRNDSFASVNQALRLARGVQCDSDWKAADLLFGKIEATGDVLEWWFARGVEGDPEGHLVTGWLGRHQLATDPDGLRVAERIDLARSGGWLVPEWMNDPVKSAENV